VGEGEREEGGRKSERERERECVLVFIQKHRLLEQAVLHTPCS
jgi:hypothetical protein